MTQTYYPQGTCSTEIRFEVAEGVLRKVEFADGCDGNLTGIGRLVTGMKVEDVNKLLKQHADMLKMMKRVNKLGEKGFMRSLGGMGMPPGFPR